MSSSDTENSHVYTYLFIFYFTINYNLARLFFKKIKIRLQVKEETQIDIVNYISQQFYPRTYLHKELIQDFFFFLLMK